jgi:hypothetical protein
MSAPAYQQMKQASSMDWDDHAKVKAAKHGNAQRTFADLTKFAGVMILALLADKADGFQNPNKAYLYVPFIIGGAVSGLIVLALVMAALKRAAGSKSSGTPAVDGMIGSSVVANLTPVQTVGGQGFLDSMLLHLQSMHNPVLKAGYVLHLLGFLAASILMGLYGMQLYGVKDGFRWWYLAVLLLGYVPIEAFGRIYEFADNGTGDLEDTDAPPSADTGDKPFSTTQFPAGARVYLSPLGTK